MNIDSTAIIVGLIVGLFYTPVAFLLLKRIKQKHARKEFFHGVLSVLSRVSDNKQASEEISIIYRKLCERYPAVSQHYKSARDFLEDFFTRGNAYTQVFFKQCYGFTVSDPQKNRLVKIVSMLKEADPYGSVSSKHGNLLNMIDHSLESQNKDLGKNSLRSLADDIEMLETTITQQNRRNLVSIMVSIVGVVLTLVFGAMTVIQYISETHPS